MTKRKIISWTAVIFWMVIIFFLSHQPGSQSSELSAGVTKSIINIAEKISPAAGIYVEDFHTYIRKSAHFIAYLLLGMLTLNALRASNVRSFRSLFFAFGICAMFAVSDEFHQLFIEERSGEVRDVLIDSSGAAAGLGLYSAVKKVLSLRKSSFN